MDDSELIRAIGEALYGERYKADLAAALRVSRDSVDDWSKGRMRPRPGVWDELATIVAERRKALEHLATRIDAAGVAARKRQA